MWAFILKYAVKIAIYAAGHPDQVKAAVDEAVALKKVL